MSEEERSQSHLLRLDSEHRRQTGLDLLWLDIRFECTDFCLDDPNPLFQRFFFREAWEGEISSAPSTEPPTADLNPHSQPSLVSVPEPGGQGGFWSRKPSATPSSLLRDASKTLTPDLSGTESPVEKKRMTILCLLLQNFCNKIWRIKKGDESQQSRIAENRFRIANGNLSMFQSGHACRLSLALILKCV